MPHFCLVNQTALSGPVDPFDVDEDDAEASFNVNLHTHTHTCCIPEYLPLTTFQLHSEKVLSFASLSGVQPLL